MIVNIILICLIVSSLAVIGFVVGRKLPRIRTMDVDTVPEAQAARVRDRIMLEKMRRSAEKGRQLWQRRGAPLLDKLGDFFRGLLRHIYSLEKKYKKEAEDKKVVGGRELENKIIADLNEAEKLLKAEDFGEAEKRLIEVVSHDPKRVPAYRLLFDLYFATKEYKQALQTAQFLLKLVSKQSKTQERRDEFGRVEKNVSNARDLAVIYSNVGDSFRALEKLPEALENYTKALEFEPNNPRHLDQSIELCIMLKQKSPALDLLHRLEQVNPDNQKLREYRERVKEI